MKRLNPGRYCALTIGVAVTCIVSGCKETSPAQSTSTPASSGPVTKRSTFVGVGQCKSCHSKEFESWKGSHHDLAMQEATDQTVLGDFNHAQFESFGHVTTFDKKDGKFLVRTDGLNGEPTEYQVAYTFGVFPLQQYLLPLAGGRLQALSIAWDTRPKDSGGQRWFHLYPDEDISANDELHWTQPSQNWNYTCADCHSTNLQKNYDLKSNTYATTWSEIDVACEACHGPGSGHVEWAANPSAYASAKNDQKGFEVIFDDRRGVGWEIDLKTGSGVRSSPITSRKEIETCARCHARSTPIWDDFEYGHPILDSRLTTLLEENLYFADGQNRGEVYEYRSYLQSKMYHKGVTCSDCHDPHSLTLRGTGNSVCALCHSVDRFDTPKHHFHKAGSPGATCAGCHMPERTYMVIDKRRGHSIRIPRPDLSRRLGSPNACNLCHEDRTNEWAEEAIARWYGPNRNSGPHYGDAIYLGREGYPQAESGLAALATMKDAPGIVRATALSLLGRYVSDKSAYAIQLGLGDSDAIVRVGAVRGARSLPEEKQREIIFPLLNDPIRAVRMEAVEALTSIPIEAMDATRRSMIDRVAEEYRRSRLAAAEQPASHVDIGNLERGLNRMDAAESAYRMAIRLNGRYAPAYTNLADLYRVRGNDPAAEGVLREGLAKVEDDADLNHALGLLQIRAGQLEASVSTLAKAVALDPDNAHYNYVYAVALDSFNQTDRAIEVLRMASSRRPRERELLSGLISICHQHHRIAEALDYARQLAELVPGDEQILQVIESLTKQLDNPSPAVRSP